MGTVFELRPTASAAELAAAIKAADFSKCAATVVGYGGMGRQYVKALQALGVQRIRVCSRSPGPLEELRGVSGVEIVGGGYEKLGGLTDVGEIAIVATPTLSLVAATERLASFGFRRLLIEKPVSLSSTRIEQLSKTLEGQGIKAVCAYNRVAYPSFHEVRSRVFNEGGITSCTYTFTEMVRDDWTVRFPADELARWGISNSLHVISMAYRLIGMPKKWSGYRCGSLPWHPTGAIFVGSGISDKGIAFSYHADWGSKGRWSVELNTAVSSYRLCPVEKLFRKTVATNEWEEVPVVAFSPEVKTGFVEQLASLLDPALEEYVPLFSLAETAALTQYAERIFGYDE